MSPILKRVVSGGQTGVDRAALDAALYAGVACGGWCPKGRLAEDGPLDTVYPLDETPSPVYAQRTEWNVRDADATLVLCVGEPVGGTALTIDLANKRRKPCLLVDLKLEPSIDRARAWIAQHDVRTLNVAGPRESTSPGIYNRARAFLDKLVGSTRSRA